MTAQPRGGDAPASVTVGGIRFRPVAGWSIARRFPEPNPGVLLTRGVGSLLVAADPEATTAEITLDSYFEEVLRPEATEFQAGVTEDVTTPDGVTTLRRPYSGTFEQNPAPLEGDVTAFVLTGGPGVVFDGWAHERAYQMVAPEVYAMVETAEPA